MKPCLSLAVLAGLFVWSGAALAEDAVTIKIKWWSAEGDSIVVSKTDTQMMKMKIVDGQGVLVDNNDGATITTEYKETVLKREGKKAPTKLEREYTKAEKKTSDKMEDLGLSGKTVIIEKKDDKFTFTMKGGAEVTGPATAVLVKEFTGKDESGEAALEKLLMPKTAVKPGDEWKVDVAKVLKVLNKDGSAEVDMEKTTGTGKLLKAYKKDGKLFGEMHIKLEMPIKSLGKGPEAIKLADGAKVVMEMTSDWCIDGTADLGTIKIKMNMTGNGTLASLPGSNVTFTINGETDQKQKEPGKK